VLPVASLWASLDYKSVANLTIRVSRILYLILLLSEINKKTFLRSHLYLGKRISYYKILFSLSKCCHENASNSGSGINCLEKDVAQWQIVQKHPEAVFLIMFDPSMNEL
jgi:hypothetical protein